MVRSLAIPLLVRRGGCGIKKISAKPTLAPQTGWSLTPERDSSATTPAAVAATPPHEEGIMQSWSYLSGPARESHRKNKTTRTAGIAGVHHASMPNAGSDVGPSRWMINMIAPAHPSALMKLRLEK